MEDEYSERALREALSGLVLTAMREQPFLDATACTEWRTLDELVDGLGAAGYWDGAGWTNIVPPEEPPDTRVGKREHTREMIAHLTHDALNDGDADIMEASKQMFATRFRATNGGGLVRVYKIASFCSPEEHEELAKEHGAEADYVSIRENAIRADARALRLGKEVSASLPEHYMSELTEETMRRAWSSIDKQGRGWIIVLGLHLKSANEEFVAEIEEVRKQGGLPTSEQVREYTARNADRRWDKIAEDIAARTGIDKDEVLRMTNSPGARFYGSEFCEVLENNDEDTYGWTLDEHLQFVVERRGEEERPGRVSHLA